MDKLGGGRRKGEIFGNEARLHKDTAAEERMTQRRKPTPCFDASECEYHTNTWYRLEVL